METEKQYALGVDIGGSHFCSSIVDLSNGEIVNGLITTRQVDGHWNASRIIDVWSQAIRESINAVGVSPMGVGIAIPGPFDYEKGVSTICGVEKFDKIFGLDITNSLLSHTHIASINKIYYTNDASAFALGECLGGAARHVSRVVALTLGTGFGSAFVVDGKLVTDGNDVPANGWAYSLPFDGGIADNQLTTRWFTSRYKTLTGKDIHGAKEIAELIEVEPEAKQIFDEYGRRLADFVTPMYDTFRGDAIVLGGNISKAYPLFSDAMNQRLGELGMKINVRISQLRDRAAMIGAASLFA